MTTDPVLGDRARLALRIDAGGRKRQKLLVLLAAYADAGEQQPPLHMLVGRARLKSGKRADALLKALERQGLIRVDWSPPDSLRRNRYQLLFGEQQNGRDAAREEHGQ